MNKDILQFKNRAQCQEIFGKCSRKCETKTDYEWFK